MGYEGGHNTRSRLLAIQNETSCLVTTFVYIFDWFSIVFSFGNNIMSIFCCFIQTWQWEAGALAVMLVWLELTMILRRLPGIGIYIVMFVGIFYTFVKVALSLLCALFGFAVCFFMLLGDQVSGNYMIEPSQRAQTALRGVVALRYQHYHNKMPQLHLYATLSELYD